MSNENTFGNCGLRGKCPTHSYMNARERGLSMTMEATCYDRAPMAVVMNGYQWDKWHILLMLANVADQR